MQKRQGCRHHGVASQRPRRRRTGCRQEAGWVRVGLPLLLPTPPSWEGTHQRPFPLRTWTHARRSGVVRSLRPPRVRLEEHDLDIYAGRDHLTALPDPASPRIDPVGVSAVHAWTVQVLLVTHEVTRSAKDIEPLLPGLTKSAGDRDAVAVAVRPVITTHNGGSAASDGAQV